MTSSQRKRLVFFTQQRKFVTELTNICERLRFVDRDLRKFYLARDLQTLKIPPFCYLPMCRSQEEFRYILRALPGECHAFSTKARVPALMLFEVERHPNFTDTATFLACEMQEYQETELAPSVALVSADANDEYHLGGGFVEESNSSGKMIPAPSRIKIHTQALGPWRSEGTGIRRLHEEVGAHPPTRALNMSPPPSPPKTGKGALLKGKLFNKEDGVSFDGQGNESEKQAMRGGGSGGGKETYAEKAARLRLKSPYGHLEGWGIDGLIAKSNDDLRQEVFVMQLLIYYQRLFKREVKELWMHTYGIMATTKNTGLVELIPDAYSIDSIKKREDYPGSMSSFFKQSFHASSSSSPSKKSSTSPRSLKKQAANDPPPPSPLDVATHEFVRSMAAYSIVAYLLAIKDRHNGNVMLDTHGHIIHIDFGFVFGLAPGKAFSMETAPWKLTEEMVDVMGGRESQHYSNYVRLCTEAFRAVRAHSKPVLTMIEIMKEKSQFPSFRYNAKALEQFRDRLALNLKDADVEAHVLGLIEKSYKHTGTGLYDRFQLATNGIAP